ncbi:hypothetical protein BLOT_013876 [Blomia tropicalis]|nr:hypothetical protein BLOT_013876 [Blomia tropicalis]
MFKTVVDDYFDEQSFIIDSTIVVNNYLDSSNLGSLPLNSIGTSGNSGLSINQSTRGEPLSSVDVGGVGGGGSGGESSIPLVLYHTIGIDSNRSRLINHQIS